MFVLRVSCYSETNPLALNGPDLFLGDKYVVCLEALVPEAVISDPLFQLICHAHAAATVSESHVASAQLDPLAASMRRLASSLMTASGE